MKDSTKTYVIANLFLILNMIGDLALLFGRINATAYFMFCWLFCIPIFIELCLLADAWANEEEENQLRYADYFVKVDKDA